MYLIGEFREKESAAAAIRSLRASGIEPADLDVFSEEPVEFPRGVLDRPSRMSLASVSGRHPVRPAGHRLHLVGAAQLPAGHRRHADLFVLGDRRDHL